MSVHKPFKSEVFIPCSSIIFLDVFPTGFQSQLFLGLSSLCWIVGVWTSDVELRSLTPQGKGHTFEFLPDCGLPWLECSFSLGESVSMFLPPILMLSFYSLLWKLFSYSFSGPFQKDLFHMQLWVCFTHGRRWIEDLMPLSQTLTLHLISDSQTIRERERVGTYDAIMW